MQEQIDSKSLAAQCCHKKNCYLVFEPSASELIYNDVIQMLEGQEFYPLFAGTRFAHVAEVSPRIIKLDLVPESLLEKLLQDRKSILVEAHVGANAMYAALAQHIEKTSDEHGLVMLRFWSPTVMKTLLNESLVYFHEWQCSKIYLPQYSGQCWESYILSEGEGASLHFAHINEGLDETMAISRIAYWLGSLPSWIHKSNAEVELTAPSIFQLMASGITNQIYLVEWANWLANHTNIQHHADWLTLITAETEHEQRFAVANELEQKIKAR